MIRIARPSLTAKYLIAAYTAIHVAAAPHAFAAPDQTGVQVSRVSSAGSAYAYTLVRLTRFAYTDDDILNDTQVMNSPEWARRDLFQVMVSGSPVQLDTLSKSMRLELQQQMAHALGIPLSVHKRTAPVYELRIASALGTVGPGMTPSVCVSSHKFVIRLDSPRVSCSSFRFSASGDVIENITMRGFAKLISALSNVDRMVIDRTELAGTYYVQVPFPLTALQYEGSSERTPALVRQLSSRLRAELGLRLVAARGSVPTVDLAGASMASSASAN
jgi:uncharacterized protein (TIGR03435 family)